MVAAMPPTHGLIFIFPLSHGSFLEKNPDHSQVKTKKPKESTCSHPALPHQEWSAMGWLLQSKSMWGKKVAAMHQKQLLNTVDAIFTHVALGRRKEKTQFTWAMPKMALPSLEKTTVNFLGDDHHHCSWTLLPDFAPRPFSRCSKWCIPCHTCSKRKQNSGANAVTLD